MCGMLYPSHKPGPGRHDVVTTLQCLAGRNCAVFAQPNHVGQTRTIAWPPSLLRRPCSRRARNHSAGFTCSGPEAAAAPPGEESPPATRAGMPHTGSQLLSAPATLSHPSISILDASPLPCPDSITAHDSNLSFAWANASSHALGHLSGRRMLGRWTHQGRPQMTLDSCSTRAPLDTLCAGAHHPAQRSLHAALIARKGSARKQLLTGTPTNRAPNGAALLPAHSPGVLTTPQLA
jgi:hypothetical protein